VTCSLSAVLFVTARFSSGSFFFMSECALLLTLAVHVCVLKLCHCDIDCWLLHAYMCMCMWTRMLVCMDHLHVWNLYIVRCMGSDPMCMRSVLVLERFA